LYASSRKWRCGALGPCGFRTIERVSQASHLRYERKLLIDHTSPHGPRASAVRGSLVLASLKLLKETGHYPTYEANLPPEQRDELVYLLAASWVPISLLATHFATVDGLDLSDAQLARIGETTGAQILDSLFGAMVRAARQAGADAGPWIAMRQVDRIWERIFQVGGAAVIQTGPKDAIIEVQGLPIAGSRFFRVSHSAFIRGAMMLVAKACFVKPVAARKPNPESFAVSLSWV
jgi:hypothetical protein